MALFVELAEGAVEFLGWNGTSEIVFDAGVQEIPNIVAFGDGLGAVGDVSYNATMRFGEEAGYIDSAAAAQQLEDVEYMNEQMGINELQGLSGPMYTDPVDMEMDAAAADGGGGGLAEADNEVHVQQGIGQDHEFKGEISLQDENARAIAQNMLSGVDPQAANAISEAYSPPVIEEEAYADAEAGARADAEGGNEDNLRQRANRFSEHIRLQAQAMQLAGDAVGQMAGQAVSSAVQRIGTMLGQMEEVLAQAGPALVNGLRSFVGRIGTAVWSVLGTLLRYGVQGISALLRFAAVVAAGALGVAGVTAAGLLVGSSLSKNIG